MSARIALAISMIVGSATFSACGGMTTPSSANGYRVVATTSIFADLARLALGDAVSIESIVPAGVDVHTFEPSPSDAVAIASANIVIANGLGLDPWVTKLVDAAGADAADLLLLGEGLDTSDGWIYLDTTSSPNNIVDGVSTGIGRDPHIWLDPKGAALYVNRIAARVISDRPDLAEQITSSRDAGVAELKALDAELRDEFAGVPIDRRRLVSFHDAFGYFARAYGIEIVGVAIQAPGQDPSAKEIAALIEAIRAAKITAIFSESQFPTRVAERIASEAGATVVASLYSDALGAPPADTYLGAMRANAAALLGAMR